MSQPSLLVQSGPLRGRELSISGAQTIGRAENCDLALAGYQRVSRQHARFEWDGRVLSVRDTQSTNGLLVNGQKVGAATLRQDDQIQLGDFSALVRLPTATTSAPASNFASRAGGVKAGLARGAGVWRALGAPQKGGIIGTAAIVLILGAIGLSGQGAPNVPTAPAARVENFPAVPAAPSSGAPGAPAGTNVQTGVAPAVEPVGGKLAPQALASVKTATVLIAHRDGRAWAMGSGFALADARRIVTNRHVVVGEDGRISDCRLVFEAGTPRERSVAVPAANIRVAPQTKNGDFQDDLAVITLDSGQTPALAAGQSEDLQETDEVYAVGFPLGVQTLTIDGDLPSVSVKATRVERLQKRADGAVSVIQLGGSVTHGNSGGPVVNNRGEVVGVISSGVEGTGMSYAIPMVWVKALG